MDGGRDITFVLLVTRRAVLGELVRQTLGAQGWWVTAVGDRETAVRSASGQAPRLVLVDGEVEESAELVRFFASRHGGPGVLLLGAKAAADGTPPDSADNDADAVLGSAPSAEDLAATVRRLLQPAAAPNEGLPTPGKVLNASDIFGDMLLEMEGDPALGGPPPASDPMKPPPPLDTRPMMIPAPWTDGADEDPYATPPLPDPPALGLESGTVGPEDRSSVGPVAVPSPAEGAGQAMEAAPAPARESSLAAPDWSDPSEVSDPPERNEAPPQLIHAVSEPSEPEPEPEPELEQEQEQEPEPEPVPAPAAAAPTSIVAPAAAEGEEPALPAAPDPAPPISTDTLPDAAPPEVDPTAAAPPSRPRSRLALPGGVRFWLGVAAGLLAFLAASFLLDYFMPAAPGGEPSAVTVQPVDPANLEELVDQEMAEREAALRESLLEEERRLQKQLDEMNGDG